MTRRKGRERKADYVTTWGEVVKGAYLSTDGRLRPIGKSKPAFGPADNERLAVHRFKQWQAKQTGQMPQSKTWGELQAMSDQDRARWYSQGRIRQIPESERLDDADGMLALINAERERIRFLIMNDPKQAAIELSIPYLAEYPVSREKPHFTLAALVEEYVKNKRNKRGQGLQRKYVKNLKAWWKEFLETIGNPAYARDISRSLIQKYHASVIDKGKSPAFVKGRFAAVRAVLQYGVDFTDDSKDCRAALDYCGILIAPSKESKPQPISRDHYQALLSVADAREKAILLLGLNLAMHNGEVASIRKSELDLSAGTFSADRNKTGIRRVAQLWKRTIDAIRDYQAEHRHQSEFLFVSRTGKALTGEAIRQLFLTLRKNAHLPDQTFEGLRDGAYLQAFRVSPIYARWIGGHASWTRLPSESKDITNEYVERSPLDPNVIACCEAVERAYFPPDQQAEQADKGKAGKSRGKGKAKDQGQS